MTDQTGTSATRPAPSPVTGAEQIRWQRHAATLLGRLLELAAKRDLPAINWTVATGAALAGECLAHPHSDRRAQLGPGARHWANRTRSARPAWATAASS
jgi:hypothetical protein